MIFSLILRNLPIGVLFDQHVVSAQENPHNTITFEQLPWKIKIEQKPQDPPLVVQAYPENALIFMLHSTFKEV